VVRQGRCHGCGYPRAVLGTDRRPRRQRHRGRCRHARSCAGERDRARPIPAQHPRAFENDELSRAIAKLAVAISLDQRIAAERRIFLYLPFEHSEALADQYRSVELISSLGDEEYIRFAEAHCDVVARFGRFPHRNAILGRPSTAEEAAFLEQPGSAF
jgi:uncharacterized protein (DUF924 family)